MPISIYSKEFQQTTKELEDALNSGNLSGDDPDNINRYISEVKGLNLEDYWDAYDVFDAERKADPEKEFVPFTELGPVLGTGTRIAGRALGTTGSAITELAGDILPESVNKFFQEKSREVGEALPDYVVKAADMYFDPFHGDDLGGTAEEVAGEVASFFIPYTGIAKGYKVAKGAKGISSILAPAQKALAKNELRRRTAKAAGAAGLFAGIATYADPTDYKAIEILAENPEADKALKEYLDDPSNTVAKRRLDSYLENLAFEGAFVGAGFLARPIYNAIKKSKAGRVAARHLTSRRGTDDQMLANMITYTNAGKAALSRVQGRSQDLKRSVKKNDIGKIGSKKDVTGYLDLALKGDKNALSKLSTETQEIVGNMRNDISGLQKYVRDNVFSGDLKAKIDAENLETYITRSYQFFDNPAFARSVRKKVEAFEKGANPDASISEAVTYFKKQGLSDDEVIKELKDLTSEVDGWTAFKRYSNPAANPPLAGTARVTAERKDIPQEIRALWGEVKDPYENYAKTFAKLSKLKSEREFMRDVVDDLTKRGIATAEKGGEKINIREIFNKRAKAIFGDTKQFPTALKGLPTQVYVPKEYGEFIADALNPEQINPLLKFIAASKGLSQKSKTVYNPGTHGRNTVGNMVIMLANGMVPGGGSIVPALKSVASDISGLSNRELSDYRARLIELGVADSGVTLGVIRNNLQSIMNMTDDKMARKILKSSGLSQVDDKVTRLYQAEDDLFKIMHFEKTKSMLKQAYPNLKDDLAKQFPDAKGADLDALVTREIESMAAQRTRDLMPNYNLVPRAFTNLRYAPVGDFLAFPAEMTRVSKNLLKYTIDDLKSGNPRLMAEAGKRLAGMTAAATVPAYATSYTQSLFGITDEQHDALENLVPDYQADAGRIYLSGIKELGTGGKGVEYFNLGPVDPFEYLKTPARALHRAILSDNLDEVDKSRVMLSVVDKVLGPFFGPSMITESLLEIGTNKKGPSGSFKRAVQDALTPVFGEGLSTAAGQVIEPFTPGFMNFLENRYKYEKAKAFQQGQPDIGLLDVVRGSTPATGEEITNQFAAYNTGNTDLLALLGGRRELLDITRSANFTMRPYLRNIENAPREFNRAIQSPNLLPAGQNVLVDEYYKANEKSLENQALLRSLIDNYRTLGLTDADIEQGLTAYGYQPRGVSDQIADIIRSAEQNVYKPVEIPENIYNYISASYGYDPEVFADIYNQLQGTSIR